MIVVPAVGVSYFDRVAALSLAYPGCVYALGIHPMYVQHADEADLATLRARVQVAMADPRFVGVGEIGLDFFVPGLDRQRQMKFFAEQLRIARDFDLPVILHVRRSQDEILKQLRIFKPKSGIAHAFNGSLQQAQAYLKLEFALGFGGAMTFTRALQIRRLASQLPDTAHVLETDAPDISPAWLHPARNSPAELPRIADCFAELRGQSIDAVVRTTGANALRVLPRLANPSHTA